MTRDSELLVEAIIEIPKGARNKYKFDPSHGVFRLDRVLYWPMHFPADYGFVPGTLAEDGDPLDILVLLSAATFPGCLVPARVIGALVMEDEKGLDTKLLSVAIVDPRYEKVRQLRHLSPYSIKEMEYFFGIYKDLEGMRTAIAGWRDGRYAGAALDKAKKAWAEAQGAGTRGVTDRRLATRAEPQVFRGAATRAAKKPKTTAAVTPRPVNSKAPVKRPIQPAR